MTDRNYAIVRTRTLLKASSGIGIGTVARRSGVHPDIIVRFVRLGLVEPLHRPDNMAHWRFHEDAVGVVSKILRLRSQLGINYAGIGVVLELLTRIERLESRLLKMGSRHLSEWNG